MHIPFVIILYLKKTTPKYAKKRNRNSGSCLLRQSCLNFPYIIRKVRTAGSPLSYGFMALSFKFRFQTSVYSLFLWRTLHVGQILFVGGNHKCTSSCHSGKCFPCPVTITKSCPCGQTLISVPCIRQKTAQPPKCHLPCTKPSICHHLSIQRHSCHNGECPPCRLACDKKLPGCGHTCDSQCHDAKRVLRKEVNHVYSENIWLISSTFLSVSETRFDSLTNFSVCWLTVFKVKM